MFSIYKLRATATSTAPMAERKTTSTTRSPSSSSSTSSVSNNSSNSSSRTRETSQVMGLMMLVVSCGILLLFTGLTVTVTVLGFIFFLPLILLTSPIWVPIGSLLFITFVMFLCLCGFGVAMFMGLPWIYRKCYYLFHSGSYGSWAPGAHVDEYDGRRRRIAGVADQMTFIARDQGGGYVQTRVKKDAAPSA